MSDLGAVVMGGDGDVTVDDCVVGTVELQVAAAPASDQTIWNWR